MGKDLRWSRWRLRVPLMDGPTSFPSQSMQVAAVRPIAGNMSTYQTVAVQRPGSVELKSGQITLLSRHVVLCVNATITNITIRVFKRPVPIDLSMIELFGLTGIKQKFKLFLMSCSSSLSCYIQLVIIALVWLSTD